MCLYEEFLRAFLNEIKTKSMASYGQQSIAVRPQKASHLVVKSVVLSNFLRLSVVIIDRFNIEFVANGKSQIRVYVSSKELGNR